MSDIEKVCSRCVKYCPIDDFKGIRNGETKMCIKCRNVEKKYKLNKIKKEVHILPEDMNDIKTCTRCHHNFKMLEFVRKGGQITNSCQRCRDLDSKYHRGYLKKKNELLTCKIKTTMKTNKNCCVECQSVGNVVDYASNHSTEGIDGVFNYLQDSLTDESLTLEENKNAICDCIHCLICIHENMENFMPKCPHCKKSMKALFLYTVQSDQFDAQIKEDEMKMMMFKPAKK